MQKENHRVVRLSNWKQRSLILLLKAFIFMHIVSCNTSQAPDKNDEKDTVVNREKKTPLETADTTHVDKQTALHADWLLVPGVAAGGTKIGSSADSVYERLGTPDGGDAAMQKAVAIWYANHDTTSYSTAIYTARNPDTPSVARVLQIRVTSPAFQTAEGIQVTSGLPDILKQFDVKKTEQYADDNHEYNVYDSRQGIAFEMDAVTHQCVAIVVHKSGVTGEGTYLKFRTTNKYITHRK